MQRLDITSRNIVICDLDGTIALDDHRAHFLRGSGNPTNDWKSYFDACGGDAPNHAVIQLLRILKHAKKRIYILSGRVERTRIDTLAWLENHKVPWDALEMRPDANRVDDTVLKLGWLDTLGIRDQVWLILEDRTRMVDAWRKAGFTCFQVRPGDF